MTDGSSRAADIDCVVVGAGFSGLYATYRLTQLGLTLRCFDAGVDVGGVWNWNRYPGATVDVLSRDYSYSFCEDLQRDWHWGMRYSRQPEIVAYQQHVVERFDLRRFMQFETRVTSTIYDEATDHWEVRTDRGDVVNARYIIMASGHLSSPNQPDIPGFADFKGETYHTGYWPREQVEFAGKRVGVIGTGSSGIQIITAVAPKAEHLTVFQRTPHYSLPINNAESNRDVEQTFKLGYPEYRAMLRRDYRGVFFMDGTPMPSALAVSEAERNAVYEQLWAMGGPGFLRNSFQDIMTSQEANDTCAEFVRKKIGAIVKDPVVAEKLKPRGYPIGTKRICLDEGYYEAFNRDNVSLVDIKSDPIERFTANGIVVAGQEHPLDMIVFATGCDAFTGSLFKIDIRGRDGLILREKWEDGPVNYLGMMISDFPNLFNIQGPGSPSIFANVVTGTEQQIDWIADAVAYLDDKGYSTIEAEPEAEQRWLTYCDDIVKDTLFTKAQSWWVGTNVPGKKRFFYAFAGGFQDYSAKCKASADSGYADFRLGKRKVRSAAQAEALTA